MAKARTKSAISTWHVRLIKDDTYHPTHKGWIVRVPSNDKGSHHEAKAKVARRGLDTDEGGEHEGYELTCDVVEFAGDVAEL